MIITCPNCQTKYEVADQAIGAAGRKVQCANCHQSWKAVVPLRQQMPAKPRIVAGTDTDLPEAEAVSADPDRLFGTDNEAALDKAFSEEEQRAQQVPDWAEMNELEHEDAKSEDGVANRNDEEESLDQRLISRRKRDLARRQKKHASRLPLARIRRAFRMASLVVLMTLVGLAYQFRVDIVRAFPDLGGLYTAIGLPVNVYGLTFSNVETLRTLKDGADVTIITANIRSIVGHTVRVPPVLVSILNAEGEPIYEWTARAPVENISPGDIVAFETQLTSAPADAAHVRLVFGSGTAANTVPTEQSGP